MHVGTWTLWLVLYFEFMAHNMTTEHEAVVARNSDAAEGVGQAILGACCVLESIHIRLPWRPWRPSKKKCDKPQK